MGLGFKIYKKIVNEIYGEWIVNNKVISKVGRKLHSRLHPGYIEMFGYKLYLDPNDHLLLSTRKYPIHPILERIIKKNNVVVDVGSNIGVLTLYFASLVGSKGKVYSFEPESDAFSILSKNVTENNMKNIIVENKAVSNKTGKVLFRKDESPTAGRIVNDNSDGTSIDSISLDDYFLHHDGEIDFVKIDTEGYDWSVFQGMKSLIEKNKNLKIMSEFHTRLLNESGKNPREFLKIIQDFGFIIYDMGGLMDRFDLLEGKTLEKYATTPNSSNLLCVKEKLSQL